MWNVLMLLKNADEQSRRRFTNNSRRAIIQKRTSQREKFLRQFPEWQFSAHYRLDKVEFTALCCELRECTGLRGSKTISLELKVN